MDRHLACIHVLGIVNSAAMNIGLHISFWIMIFSGYMPMSGIAGSYGSSFFSFLKNLYTVLHSGCTSLYSHQQCRRLAFIFHRFFFFFYNGHSDSVRWYLSVVLTCISLISSDVGHLSMCLLTICMSSLEICLFRFPTHSLIVFCWCLFSLYWAAWAAICIFWRLISCQSLCLQIFSLILWTVFSLYLWFPLLCEGF